MEYEGTRITDTDAALGNAALDTSALAQALPDIVATAAAVARSGAIPLVPDANNTVVLPAGASLDDITVRGRDLIIQTDDGRTYIIVDGAVFVPQVVSQGITVPPLNLAALLIGNEPEPAAGGVRSSGGNFAVPVGSIQAAYEIGNLLPYTELAFPEPRAREIFPAVNLTPIAGPNADVQLDDDALSGGNPGGTGDDADAANTSGVLSGSDGDGALTWALSLDGAPDGFSYVANGTGLDVYQGAVKVLAVTLDPATGAYTVTQVAVIAHPPGDAENNQLFTLTYTVTDSDGDSASGTLGINVDDDSPLAAADTDTVAAGEFGPATGNILSDAAAGDAGDGDNGRDSVGADGGLALTAISGFGGAGAIGGVTQGQYGVLTLDALGNYSYVRNPGTPGGVTDTFNYTIRDADGDTASTTLTITIENALPQTAPNAVVQLDDDAFPGGNPGGTGDDADAANLTGTLAGSGGDGSLTWALSAGGAPDGFSYVATPTGLNVLQGSTVVLAVTLNPATGAYTVTQVAVIAHAAGGDENNAVFTIGYSVTDSDGDPAAGTLTINVDDDTPTVAVTGRAPALSVDETNLAANASQDLSVLFTQSFGADGAAASGSTGYALGVVAGPSGLVDTLTGQNVVLAMNGAVVEGRTTGGLLVFTATVDANGTVTLDQTRAVVHSPNLGSNDVEAIASDLVTLTKTVTDSDGDTASATTGIGALLQFVDDAPAAADDTDSLLAGATGPATGNVITDAEGDGGQDAPGADGGSVTAVTGFGGAGTIGGTTQGQYGTLTLNADGSYSYVRTGTGPINAAETFTYSLTDGDGDTATATLTITLQDAAPITGPNAAVQLDDDAFAGGNPGGTGDDADAVNTTGTLAGSGGDGTLGYALTGITLPAGFTSTVVNPGLVEVRQGGTLVLTVTLDTATGAYTVTQNAPIDHTAGGDENNAGFTLNYAVTDADGDSAAGTLAINVDDDTPLAADDTDAILSGATTAAGNVLTGAGSDGNPAGADSVGADGPATGGAVTAISGFNGAGTIGGSTQGQFGTLTLNADGSYSYTRTSGAAGNSEDVFTYTITDGDGDTATATLTISIEDARPFTGPNAPVQLDDDALPGGNPGGTGDVDPDTANLTGTLSGSGGDGALTFAFGTITAPAGFTVTTVNPGLVQISQGGTPVLSITLNPATGAYSVTQLAAIDHAAGLNENDLAFTVNYTVTDADGDAAGGSIVINVDDDTPTVTANGTAPNLSVDETSFAGNDTADLSTLFTHSFGADGPATTGSIGYTLGVVAGPSGLVDTLSGQAVNLVMNGAVVEGRTAGSNLLVFTVAVDGSGNVTLDQSRAVVHLPNAGPNDVTSIAANLVTLTKTVTDGDNDSASATAGIGDRLRFVDDAPTAGANAAVSLNDDLLAGGNAGGTGDTGAAQNTSGTLSHTFGNDGGTLSFLTTGAPAGFQYVASGSNLLVQQSQGGVFVTVATVTLVPSTGAYTVTQNAPVLHPTSGTTEESLSFTLNYVVTDGDNDTAPGTLLVTVNDDTPTAAADTDSVTEDGAIVADGNVFTGVGGADANATDGAKDSIGADGAALAGPVTAIAFGANAGTIGTALAGTYGSLTLNANGSYSYALNNASPLVQGLDTGETRTDIFTYTITDRDGDTTTATLTITINGANDAPVVTPSTTAVSEEGLPLGNPDTTGNTDTTNSPVVTGTITATDPDGEPLTYTLGLPTPNLTSGGVPIIWTGVGTATLTGSAGATPVITVTIDASGNYTVTLLGHIDHPNAAIEDSLNLTVPVNVSDGTTSTGTTITVSIEDDSPVAVDFASTSGSVDEDGLAGGIAGGPVGGGDLAGQATVATGSVVGLFAAGADTAPQYLLTTVAGLPSLTSGGVTVTYSLNTATNVLTATAAGNPVFTLAIDKSTGAWTFTLQGPVDHALGAAENDLVLDFAAIVQAVDFDGDRASVTGTFKITIDDDTPVAVNDGASQTTANAAVTIDVFTNDQKGADGALVSTVALVAGSLTNGGSPATGTLINNGNGTFTYTPGPGEEGTISFAYTITDKDGDPSQATATITLLGDSVPQVVNVVAAVDDDGLGGNAASVAGDIDANIGDLDGLASSEASFRGQLTVNFGTDTGTVSFANLNGTSGLVGTETVNYAWNALTNTLTATGPRGPLFSVTLTPSGAYTVTLLDNVLHASGGAETSAPVVDLFYLAADSDGDSSTAGKLSITFNDDAPSITASATQPMLTVDETILATNASASFATVFTPVFGADGAGAGTGMAYTLGVGAGASGLTDSLTGEAVNLVLNGTVVEGRSATTNQLVFTVSVDAAGNVTLDQQRAVLHTPDTGPDQTVSLASDTLVTLTATATDADGDSATATANIGQNLTFVDDAPDITNATTPLAIANSGTLSNTGAFAFTTGSDGPAAGNDAIKSVTFAATVNGAAVINPVITAGAETATTATYTFSFTYATGTSTTAVETGTLVFDKVAGTYTVDLDNPIQGISTNGTANGQAFLGYEPNSATSDGSQPAVAVTQITNSLFAQFTSVAEPSSGTGANNLTTVNYGLDGTPPSDGSGLTFSNGELFSQAASWVSVSNTANGVAGDTIGGGEVLDFNLYSTNPQGFLNTTPTASADGMYLKFDGIGAQEDLIVVLKLYDTVTGEYTTKALLVQNSDIQKGPGTGPSIYNNITLDNNDGLIVIESNDFNSGGSNFVIVGAQIVASDEGVVGTAINFNNALGAGGASTGTQSFATDSNDGPMKISDIGFVVTTVTQQTAQLTFDVTVQDRDGDTDSQTLVVNIGGVPPVAMDLDGNGVQYLAVADGVAFDYDGDGVAEQTAWVAANDGLLAIDANGSGSVDSASEIVFGGNGLTDLEGVAAKYDSNADGVLDASDAAFAQFGVWQDANSNGVSDAGEFQSLTALGIASLDLTSDGEAGSAAGGDVTVFGTTSYTRTDGSTGIAADVAFATSAALQRQMQPVEVAAMSAAATGLLAAMALDHASSNADKGLETAQARTADLPVEAVAAADAAYTSPALSAFAQFASGAAAKVEALADSHGNRADSGHDRAALDRVADHGSAKDDAHADTGKSALFASHDSHSAMDALLTIAAPAASGPATAAPAVALALADAAASHAVDNLVDHFAADTAGSTPAAAEGSDFALQGLLDSTVQGTGHDAGGPQVHIMQVLDHEQAAALA